MTTDRAARQVLWYPTIRQKTSGMPPNFLHVALDKSAWAPFFKERSIRCTEPTKLHRKSGMWGTRTYFAGRGKPVIDLSTPRPRAGLLETTIVFEHSIPRFQERSAELQIPPRRAGVGGMTKEAVATSGNIHPAAKPVEQMFRQHNRIESGASLSGVSSLIKFRRIVGWASPFVLVPRTLLRGAPVLLPWGSFCSGQVRKMEARIGIGSFVDRSQSVTGSALSGSACHGSASLWPLRVNSRKPCYRQW
jgi:hypothetical protein